MPKLFEKFISAFTEAQKQIERKKQTEKEIKQEDFMQEAYLEYNLFLRLNRLNHSEALFNAFNTGTGFGIQYAQRRFNKILGNDQ